MPMHKIVEVTFMLYYMKSCVLSTCKSELFKKVLDKPQQFINIGIYSYIGSEIFPFFTIIEEAAIF